MNADVTDKFKLPASMLAPLVEPSRLGFADTSELDPLDDTIGQERAVEALEFGLRMQSAGFNIYVSGPVGTGRGSLVRQRQYARFIARLCRDERLPPFRADAVAEVIREGFRLAERHDRLTLRFSQISDLVREAGFWAKRDGRSQVTGADVESAVAHKRHRANLSEQWIQDEIKEGTLLVDLDGEVVGQVNGLSVHQLGDYSFGRPCRITARTFVGTKGLIDIQREAELAGHIHSKGVMTLAGFLAGKFAGAHPFALSASLTFERTYSEVEGDSAAVAELAAVLSSLADVPVRQWLAVTGSVNQLGEVQPIGGVNEKIEGFFESCKKRGLVGHHGVIIPARNTKHLALRREVIEAVEAGTFAVYGVNTVEEALLVLTLQQHEKGEVKCPACGSANMQQMITSFIPHTTKKS